MIKLDLKPRAVKFIKKLPPKHRRQIKSAILSLQENPHPHDARPLVGYDNYLRADCGEYRIIYRYELKKELVTVVLVRKRNDDEVYKIANRILN